MILVCVRPEQVPQSRSSAEIIILDRVFLIDGIITMPIAIMGYMYFPDTPEKTKASFLKESEKRLALTRLPVKREDGHNINPWSLAKRVVTSPAL